MACHILSNIILIILFGSLAAMDGVVEAIVPTSNEAANGQVVSIGTLLPRENRIVEVILRNPYDEPIDIPPKQKACSCTKIVYPNRIPSAGSAALVVTIVGKDYSGDGVWPLTIQGVVSGRKCWYRISLSGSVLDPIKVDGDQPVVLDGTNEPVSLRYRAGNHPLEWKSLAVANAAVNELIQVDVSPDQGDGRAGDVVFRIRQGSTFFGNRLDVVDYSLINGAGSCVYSGAITVRVNRYGKIRPRPSSIMFGMLSGEKPDIIKRWVRFASNNGGPCPKLVGVKHNIGPAVNWSSKTNGDQEMLLVEYSYTKAFDGLNASIEAEFENGEKITIPVIAMTE